MAEAHGSASLYTFWIQLFSILDNKMYTYIHMHFSSLPLEFGAGIEAFESQMAALLGERV